MRVATFCGVEIQFIAVVESLKHCQNGDDEAVGVVIAVSKGITAIFPSSSHLNIRIPVVTIKIPHNAGLIQVVTGIDESFRAPFRQHIYPSDNFAIIVLQ